jgi:hypothetical protein
VLRLFERNRHAIAVVVWMVLGVVLRMMVMRVLGHVWVEYRP